MPQAADITVKKADGTTNIVWSNVQQSSGDRSPATWRSNSVGTANSHRPVIQVTSRPNGNKTARRIDISGSFPEAVVGGDSIARVANNLTINASFGVPESMSDAVKAEAVHQFANLIASALFKAQVNDGYAAT